MQTGLNSGSRFSRARRRNRLIASERMDILLNLSLETLSSDPSKAQRYFQLARKLGTRYKVRLPSAFRSLVCKSCKRLIVPGINARVRLQQRREPHMVVTCLECGGRRRMPLRRREKVGK